MRYHPGQKALSLRGLEGRGDCFGGYGGGGFFWLVFFWEGVFFFSGGVCWGMCVNCA